MERRKSVGEIVQEIEGLSSAPSVKANGVADRLPALKKDNGVADILPAKKRGRQGCKTIWNNEDNKIARKMSVKAVHKKWEIVKICWNIMYRPVQPMGKECGNDL